MTDAHRTKDQRSCTCHPDDRPPMCMERYAASECQHAYEVAHKAHLYGNLLAHLLARGLYGV